jgi:ketosteroid isomerase-like protein
VSDDNAAMLARWYRHFNDDERSALLAMLAPDFVYTSSGAFPDFDAVYEGRAGFARFLDTQGAPWRDLRAEVIGVFERAGALVVEVKLRGMGGGSGVEVGQTFHHVWRFSGGSAIRLDSRRTRAEALAAADSGEAAHAG